MTKKISLMGAVLIIIGQTIGIGLFFKSHGIFESNDNNPIGIILSWLIGGILTLFAGLSITQLSRTKQEKYFINGFSQWINTSCGKTLGDMSYFFRQILFFSSVTFMLSVFCLEAIFESFNYHGDIWIIFITSFIVCLLITYLNMVKRTVMVKLPHYIGAIKFVPMILCVVAAIIVACTGKGIDGLEYDNLFISKDVGKLSFSGVFNSIPAILFAYNGYLVVGNLVNKINDPKKTVPRAMSIANSIIIGIYITISITLIVNGATGGIILNIFGEGLGKTLMSIVLFIVSLGSVVLFNAVSFNTVDEAINFKQTIGSVLLNKLDNKKSGLGSLTLNYLLFVLYFIIFSIPSIILDTDAIFDSSSNVGTFITFMLCGILFLGFLIKYFKKKINIKIKFHNLAIIIFSGICVFIIAIYSIFYDFIAEICNDPYGKSVSGIFYQNQGINNILDGLVFWITIIFFILLTLINQIWINKKRHKI